MCTWQSYNSGWICLKCSHFTTFENLDRLCDEEINIGRKIVNFGNAMVAHEIAGRPIVNEEILKDRWEICKKCPAGLYQDGVCKHSTCGCPVTDKEVYRNKLSWADQKCPMGYWLESSGAL